MKNRFHNSPPDNEFARTIVGLAMKVHSVLGSGFSETVYRNALAHELRKANIAFEIHSTISVMYEGIEVGLFQADLIIGDKLMIVELKVAAGISDEHCAQLVNYLTATKIEQGLLLNFGTSLTFRTKSRTYRPPLESPDFHS